MRLDRELRLPEAETQAVCLVRAVEEADRTGSLLLHAERRRATAAVRGDQEAGTDGAVESWLGARAQALATELEGRVRILSPLRRSTRLVIGLTVPVLLIALILGLATNALGPSRRIPVLAVPLLGLIAWNVLVLVLLGLRRLAPWGSLAPTAAGRLLELLRRLAERAIGRHLRISPPAPQGAGARSGHGADGEGEILRRAVEGYLEAWFPAAAPLAGRRLARLLHAGAAVLVVGAVAGMYLRGLVFEYRVTWESTFLSSSAVDFLLGWILAPAARLLATEVPSVAAIPSSGTGPLAGPWIHLWAVTGLLFVVVPRLALASWEGRRAAALAARLALRVPEAYLRRLLAAADTAERRIDVLPFSYRPAAGAVTALKSLLYDLFGPRSEIRLQATAAYGTEPVEIEPGVGRCRIVLFSLAQTPEVEVHGELLRSLRRELADGRALGLVVDGAVYRRRLATAGGERRLAERRRSWDRVAREAGLEAVHVDLEPPLGDEALNRLLAGLWPPGFLERKP